jgi:hypothetical protein
MTGIEDSSLPESSPLFTALAYFLIEFTGFEHILHRMLWQLTGMEEKMAKLLLGEQRTPEVIKHLRKLIPISELPKSTFPRMERIFAHYVELNLMRKHLVHRKNYHSKVTGDLLLSWDDTKPDTSVLGATEYRLSDLKNARSDLEVMSRETRAIMRFLDSNTPILYSAVRYPEFFGYAWLYRQPAPQNQHP